MSDLSSKPIVNQAPGESESLVAAFEALLHMQGLRHDKLIPASVVNYDRVKNMATVQPLIMLIDVADNTHMRNKIANVPVMSLGGGGFNINFPLKKGDLGWIMAADRDISQFVQALTASAPNTLRKHSFADSWFVPDVFRNYTISEANSGAMVIQTVDGGTNIAITPGQINITAPTGVLVTTPMATFSENVTINGNLIVIGNSTTTGLTTLNGGLSATGTGGNQPCTLPQSTTIGGIAVYGHGHIQDGTSGRTAGGMVT